MALIINGHNLKIPHGARPVSNESRNTIFSCIGETRIVDSVVLDLFAGSGSFGIESLYRGARQAVFVDHTVDAKEALDYNIRLFGYQRKSQVVWDSEENFLKANRLRFDLIFVDPPLPKYAYREVDSLEHILHGDGMIIYRHLTSSRLPAITNMQIKQVLRVNGSEVVFIGRRS